MFTFMRDFIPKRHFTKRYFVNITCFFLRELHFAINICMHTISTAQTYLPKLVL